MLKDLYKKILIPTIISALVIMILHNFNFYDYDKYFIIPIFILIITYLYIIMDNEMIINNKGYIYLIPILLIIIGTILFKTNISNMMLNLIILPILISNMFLTLTNKNYHIYIHKLINQPSLSSFSSRIITDFLYFIFLIELFFSGMTKTVGL